MDFWSLINHALCLHLVVFFFSFKKYFALVRGYLAGKKIFPRAYISKIKIKNHWNNACKCINFKALFSKHLWKTGGMHYLSCVKAYSTSIHRNRSAPQTYTIHVFNFQILGPYVELRCLSFSYWPIRWVWKCSQLYFSVFRFFVLFFSRHLFWRHLLPVLSLSPHLSVMIFSHDKSNTGLKKQKQQENINGESFFETMKRPNIEKQEKFFERHFTPCFICLNAWWKLSQRVPPLLDLQPSIKQQNYVNVYKLLSAIRHSKQVIR